MANSKAKTQYWHPESEGLQANVLFTALTGELGELTNENVMVFRGCVLKDEPCSGPLALSSKSSEARYDGSSIYPIAFKSHGLSYAYKYNIFPNINLPEVVEWETEYDTGEDTTSHIAKFVLLENDGVFTYHDGIVSEPVIVFKGL